MRELINYIRAGCSGLFLQTQEEERAKTVLVDVATHTEFKLFAWTWTGGIINASDGTSRGAQGDPMELLDQFMALEERSIMLVFDLPMAVFGAPDPMLYRKIKDALGNGKRTNKVLLLVGPPPKMGWPPELEKEFTQLDLPLPTKEQLREVLREIVASANESGKGITLTEDEEAALVRAAAGMTTIEAEAAFALSISSTGRLVPSIVSHEKAQAIRKSGLLEIIDSPETMADIGGLGGSKKWIGEVVDLFTPEADKYGIKHKPRGVIFIGPSGTGKSLSAKAIRAAFPSALLIRMDIGKLKGSYVGESEHKMRAALALIEAIGDCVVWIDEVEKGLAAVSKNNGGGALDSGASAGQFDALLFKLEEGLPGAFFVITSNDISKIPPEFLQRFEDIFFVDLPGPGEREEIFAIWITKTQRKPGKFNLGKLSQATNGFSGREIKKTWLGGMRKAFAERKEVTTEHVLAAASELVPTSKSRAAEYKALREWASGNARMANTPTEVTNIAAKAIRKIA